jgi:hypothetical protein
MTTPDWLKPALYGAAAGAAALALIGFTLLGWTAAGDAARMAEAQAKTAVVAALAPICIEQAARDASDGAGAALDGVKAASSWERRDLVIAAGWATMPGAAAADRDVATACGDALVATP